MEEGFEEDVGHSDGEALGRLIPSITAEKQALINLQAHRVLVKRNLKYV